MTMPGGRFYEVEKLLAKRKLPNNRVEYLVRWRGYSKKHDSWEPTGNLDTCMDLVQDFNTAHRGDPTSCSPKTKHLQRTNAPPLVTKQKRVIKPVKVYSPEPVTKQRHSSRLANLKDKARLSAKSSNTGNAKYMGMIEKHTKALRSRLRRTRRSASPTPRQLVRRPTNLRPALSPMSKKALNFFLASRARNFDHMKKIHTRPPSADHEYFSTATQTFILPANDANRLQSGRTPTRTESRVALTSGKPLKVGEIQSSHYMQSKQFHMLKRGRCMEVIISNQVENNAVAPEVLDEIVRLLEDAEISPVSVVVFRSVGDFFCSGLSLRSFCKRIDSGMAQNEVAERYTKSLRNFVNCLIDFPKPLIAVVRGPAIGLGCAMLPHFDTVYCSERAFFSLPYTEFGHTPEACSSFLFPKIFGHCLANEMLLNGRTLSAIEAKSAGLVSQVFVHDTFEKNVLPYIKHLTAKSLEALVATKELIRYPDRSRMKHINQCEYVTAKARLGEPSILKGIKKYLDNVDKA